MLPIGTISSPFKEKFGIPRQSLLAPASLCKLVLISPYDQADCVRSLESFSHVWVQFVFHQTVARGWSALVRPPRLGGNRKVGVFASRSTHRPNSLGLSLVELVSIDLQAGVSLTLRGADLLDGTPVLDIKPYIPFVEAQPQARADFIDGPPPCLPVQWSPLALQHLAALPNPPNALVALIEQVLSQDPRPAYQHDPARRYGIRLFDLDVHFQIDYDQVVVTEICQSCEN